MHHYIKFDFDLGYGCGLPVLIEINQETKEKLQNYYQREYSDDDFISFDENYVTVNSILKSLEFFETETPIPLDFKSEYILNILLNYFEQPFEFSEIEETEPKTIHRLTPSELRDDTTITKDVKLNKDSFIKNDNITENSKIVKVEYRTIEGYTKSAFGKTGDFIELKDTGEVRITIEPSDDEKKLKELLE